MSSTIKTYKDLCDERERLKSLLVVQKQRLNDDWDGLKNELSPISNALGLVSRFTSPDKNNPLMNFGLKVAADLFITKFVLGKAGWITKLAVPFVMTNFSSNLLADKGKRVIDKISRLFSGRKPGSIRSGNGKMDMEEESTIES